MNKLIFSRFVLVHRIEIEKLFLDKGELHMAGIFRVRGNQVYVRHS
jgi:hypothetical protein